MITSRPIKEFWQEFCRSTPGVTIDTPFQTWFFGNTPKMARELAELVISGQKTATASLAEVNKINPENAPVDDGYSVVTDFEGHLMCVIQTTEIRHLPFDEVDAQFAFDEGEGDLSLAYWRQVHWAYFTKEAGALGIGFDEKSLVCCERFKVLFQR